MPLAHYIIELVGGSRRNPKPFANLRTEKKRRSSTPWRRRPSIWINIMVIIVPQFEVSAFMELTVFDT